MQLKLKKSFHEFNIFCFQMQVRIKNSHDNFVVFILRLIKFTSWIDWTLSLLTTEETLLIVQSCFD